MAGRRTKPQVNRRNWHQQRVAGADTPKARLWAWCHWLVAEAWHAGEKQVEEATEMVRARVEDLIREREETKTR